MSDFGGAGLSNYGVGAIAFECGKQDTSISTFIAVHNCLGVATVDMLGSEEQRARILPDVI